ncbi:UNVERIFIED_CONTAM: hypothetical protein Sangu_2031300 [Sesamum angustifolium]|uniref:Retrovirus-related Pol polyprotein from transposon TNT 1-94-like beta-barrel domain-containing protein n=1 Tax=Sesamum angustifolium TaxID=2727405 RepID=A0AAW2LI95_9LAMI
MELQAYYIATEASVSGDKSVVAGNDLVSDLLEALRNVQNKMPNDPVKVHYAQIDEMACMVTQLNSKCKSSSSVWIVDTGATNHMCGEVTLFHSLTPLKSPIHIHLPDNSIALATQQGTIRLSPILILENVLLVPSF